jgi:hypothetical protein
VHLNIMVERELILRNELDKEVSPIVPMGSFFYFILFYLVGAVAVTIGRHHSLLWPRTRQVPGSSDVRSLMCWQYDVAY